MAVDKPAGLIVHGDGRTKEKTLADFILEKYPQIKGVGESIKLDSGEEIEKPGIVHRLDKETSGVILIAKNQETFLFLKNQFQNRELQKTYIAIVYGHVKNDRGVINAPIARSATDFRRWSASRGKRGKEREAVTEYKVLKRFTAPQEDFLGPRVASLLSPSQGEGKRSLLNQTLENPPAASFTLLELRPKTGRTHQIRVHMKFLNYPVVCDKLYAPKLPCPVLGINRLALHAKSIEFKKPDGQDIKIEVPLPEDLARAIQL